MRLDVSRSANIRLALTVLVCFGTAHAARASSAASHPLAHRATHTAPRHSGGAEQATNPAERGMSAGMVIGIDPESGRTGMLTADQMAKLSQKFRQRAQASAARPAPIHHADGRVSMDVRSWMRDFYVVRRGADGRLVMDCVDRPDAAAKVLHETPAPTRLEER